MPAHGQLASLLASLDGYLPVKYVAARHGNDSAIAAIAMAVGVSYDEVGAIAETIIAPSSCEKLGRVLGHFGCLIQSLPCGEMWWDGDCIRIARIGFEYVCIDSTGRVLDPNSTETRHAAYWPKPLYLWRVVR